MILKISCLLVVFVAVFATPVPSGRGIFGVDKFQGDIVLNERQKEIIFGDPQHIDANTGMLDTVRRWPTNLQGHVVVPYRIQASEGFTAWQINWMENELRLLEARTCIRFVRRTNQVDFVDITNGNGCWSMLGRQGGRQVLSMDNFDGWCFWEGLMVHEMIHALGWDHMHNSVDRDNFVEVLWNNIEPGMEFNFAKVNPSVFNNFGTPYDLRSVMHYPRWTFSRNGQDTLVPHDRSYLNVIGAPRLSDGDVTRLNRMYQCM